MWSGMKTLSITKVAAGNRPKVRFDCLCLLSGNISSMQRRGGLKRLMGRFSVQKTDDLFDSHQSAVFITNPAISTNRRQRKIPPTLVPILTAMATLIHTHTPTEETWIEHSHLVAAIA